MKKIKEIWDNTDSIEIVLMFSLFSVLVYGGTIVILEIIKKLI